MQTKIYFLVVKSVSCSDGSNAPSSELEQSQEPSQGPGTSPH